jgi:hypothetical protein
MSAQPATGPPASSLVFIDEAEVPETFNVLLYGETGAGKSTAAATAPGPIMWVNAEGRGALAYPRKIARALGTKIYEAPIPRGVSPRPILREVIEHVRYGKEPIVKTVVVDTVAKVRDGLIRDMVTPGAKNTIQQFGDVAKVLEEFVVIMRDQPVNLILLCHEEVNDVEGERIVQPLIGGALTAKIPGDMDVMAYCGVTRDPETGDVRYLGQLVAGKGRRAKDRSGGIGQVQPLNLTLWLATYRAALTVVDDSTQEGEPDNTETSEATPEQEAQLESATDEFASEFTRPLEGDG